MGKQGQLVGKNSTSHKLNNSLSKKSLFNAWISPTGKVFEVDIGYHSHFVINYIEEEYGTDYLLKMKLFSTQQMYKYFEKKGWIRVTNWRSGEFSFVFPNKIKIPHSQIKAVATICIDNNIPVPEQIK